MMTKKTRAISKQLNQLECAIWVDLSNMEDLMRGLSTQVGGLCMELANSDDPNHTVEIRALQSKKKLDKIIAAMEDAEAFLEQKAE